MRILPAAPARVLDVCHLMAVSALSTGRPHVLAAEILKIQFPYRVTLQSRCILTFENACLLLRREGCISLYRR
jgi:hypothetical protein